MLTVHEGLKTIIEALENTRLDAQKFDEGNNTAGKRVTVTLSKAMKELQVLRAGVWSIKKSRKSK